MHRLFGMVAAANRRLRTVAINGVPLDVGVLVVLPFIALFTWAIATKEMDDAAGRLLAGTVAAVCAVVFALFAQSRFRHDIVFQADRSGVALGPVDTHFRPFPRFLASGRFELQEHDRTLWEVVLDRLMSGRRGDLWFVEVPAVFEVPDPLRFSIISYLDPSRRFLGIALENRGGAWTIDGRFETLEPPESGVLHLGFEARPAMRLRFQNGNGRARRAVLSFDDDEALCMFRASLRTAAGHHWQTNA